MLARSSILRSLWSHLNLNHISNWTGSRKCKVWPWPWFLEAYFVPVFLMNQSGMNYLKLSFFMQTHITSPRRERDQQIAAAEEQEQQRSTSSTKGLQCGECSFGSIHQSWHSNKRSLWWNPNSMLPCESNFPLHVLQDIKGELDWEWG